MARGLNLVQLIGNLGKDAETRHTTSGKPVTNFSVATTERYKDEEKTEWHNVVLWDAEKVAEYLTKGTRVYVQGKIQTRKWTDKEGQTRYSTEVVCQSYGVILLGSGDKNHTSSPVQVPVPNGPVDDKDVPF